MKQVIIDIREVDEYKREHVSGSVNIPMSTFESWGLEKFKKYADNEVIILCRSGSRAHISKELIKRNCKCNVRVYEWWLIEWKKEGKDVIEWNTQNNSFYIPILRQVQIIVWFIVVISSLLAYFVNINFIFIALFVWGGLTFAWLTWTCALAVVVGKLPFNK